MNVTPKVTVIYAFSNQGQSIEPYFIFPQSLADSEAIDEHDFYNELGHLTPQIFLTWIEKHLIPKSTQPILFHLHETSSTLYLDLGGMVLMLCSRLPILSADVLSLLQDKRIYPFGYPSTRTLPFRYLFERRVRNNRSTNLMSELWKKVLVDQERTHVLRGVHCTVKTIKFYFGQIWPLLIDESRDDDETTAAMTGDHELKTFKDRCQQAFLQAGIEIRPGSGQNLVDDGLSGSVQDNDSTRTNEMIDQLNHLLVMIHRIKAQIESNPVLKIKNDGSEYKSSFTIVGHLEFLFFSSRTGTIE